MQLQQTAVSSALCLFVCLQPRGALENALKGHASSIRQIHREQVVPMEQAMVITSRTTQTQVPLTRHTYAQANAHRSSPVSKKNLLLK